jgi:pimeloyl-ACP methyl ester carboxylesterase
MRNPLIFLTLIAMLYAIACLGLFLMQRSFIYAPQPAGLNDPSIRMTLKVPGADLVLSARQRGGHKALLYFGGNAEDVSVSLPAMARDFPDRSVYLMHYRGFGGSSGSPTEADLHADARALYDLVARTQPDIVVIGRSLGSGVAIRLANERPVARLVLVTPYDSIAALGARQFPIFPVRWLITDSFESVKQAPNIRVPTLVLRAQLDYVVPGDSTARLMAAFSKGVARQVLVDGADHNSISETPQYARALHEFIDP